jgi:hypothetical protein
MDAPKVERGTFATSHQDGGVRVWDVKMGSTAANLEGVHEGPATFVRYGRDESLVVTMGRGGDIKVRNGEECFFPGNPRHKHKTQNTNKIHHR